LINNNISITSSLIITNNSSSLSLNLIIGDYRYDYKIQIKYYLLLILGNWWC